MAEYSKRKEKKAFTANRIIEAAFSIIAKGGDSNLTVTEVVRLSGVPRATLYPTAADFPVPRTKKGPETRPLVP